MIRRRGPAGLPVPRHRTFAAVGRGCPCPVAGRSLRPSWASLTRRRLRFGILPALAAYAGSRGTGSPSPNHRSGRL